MLNLEIEIKNKDYLILIAFLILFILMIGIKPVNAIDSSDWESVNVTNVTFKIPPGMEGGRLIETSYSKGNVFHFGIRSLENDRDLANSFGDESTSDDLIDAKEETLSNHYLVVLTTYVNVCKSNVTYVYLPINETIFVISFNGTEITPEIEEIINNTPESEMSKKEFYSKLEQSQKDYINARIDEESYTSYMRGYRQGESDEKSSSNVRYRYLPIYYAK